MKPSTPDSSLEEPKITGTLWTHVKLNNRRSNLVVFFLFFWLIAASLQKCPQASSSMRRQTNKMSPLDWLFEMLSDESHSVTLRKSWISYMSTFLSRAGTQIKCCKRCQLEASTWGVLSNDLSKGSKLGAVCWEIANHRGTKSPSSLSVMSGDHCFIWQLLQV